MIVQKLYIDKYKWTVTAYYAVTRYYVDEIMENLERLCSEDNYLEGAFRNLEKNSLASGLTYSNFRKKESVLVVALASSAEQFHRALMHEARHLHRYALKVPFPKEFQRLPELTFCPLPGGERHIRIQLAQLFLPLGKHCPRK